MVQTRPHHQTQSPNIHTTFPAVSEPRKAIQSAKSDTRGPRRTETDLESLSIANYRAAISRRVTKATSTSMTASSTRSSFPYSSKVALNFSSGITAESGGLLFAEKLLRGLMQTWSSNLNTNPPARSNPTTRYIVTSPSVPSQTQGPLKYISPKHFQQPRAQTVYNLDFASIINSS